MKHKSKNQVKFIQQSDYSKKVYFDASDFGGGYLLQEVTIPPNTKQRLHYHNLQTEVSYILEGEALFIFNNEEIVARPGDAFICEPEDRHLVWNKSDTDFKLIVFKVNFPQGEDTVWLEK